MTIRQTTTVVVDGKLEIQNPDLHEGDVVDVTLSLHRNTEQNQPLSDLIGKAKGCYQNANEVVDFIRSERDQWD